MRGRRFDPRALDLERLCRQGASIEGRVELAAMPRLASTLAASAVVDAEWSAQGVLVPAAGGDGQTWLHLHISASLPLQCQRCLQTFAFQVAIDRRLRFVAGEDEAARLDEQSDDDVLALDSRLDLLTLIEDELILALPLVPRHDACPQPLLAPAGADPDGAADAEPANHAFASLAAWRDHGPRRDD
jgi:DUF177 domain-containing protein